VQQVQLCNWLFMGFTLFDKRYSHHEFHSHLSPSHGRTM
jgi:hypothetical protein